MSRAQAQRVWPLHTFPQPNEYFPVVPRKDAKSVVRVLLPLSWSIGAIAFFALAIYANFGLPEIPLLGNRDAAWLKLSVSGVVLSLCALFITSLFVVKSIRRIHSWRYGAILPGCVVMSPQGLQLGDAVHLLHGEGVALPIAAVAGQFQASWVQLIEDGKSLVCEVACDIGTGPPPGSIVWVVCHKRRARFLQFNAPEPFGSAVPDQRVRQWFADALASALPTLPRNKQLEAYSRRA